MRSYADKSLSIRKEWRNISIALKNQGMFQMKALQKISLSADSDDEVVDITLVGFKEVEVIYGTVKHIHANTPL